MKFFKRILALCALSLIATASFAQAIPQKTGIQVANTGTNIGYFSGFIRMNFTGGGCVASNVSGVLTIACTGGGSIGNPFQPPGDVQIANSSNNCFLFGGVPDVGLSDDTAGGQVDVGNCTAGDTSKAIAAAQYVLSGTGPMTLVFNPGNSSIFGGSANNAVVTNYAGSGMFGINQNNTGYITPPVMNETTAGALDNTIVSSAVNANGDPGFLGAATTNLQINGATTPLVMYIAGMRQVLASNITLAITNIGATATEQEQYAFAKQDTATPLAMVAADFERSSCVYLVAKVKPSACSAPSSTNPQYWFDTSTGIMRRSADGSTYVAQAAIFLGDFAVQGSGGTTGTVDAEAPMPFRVNPYMVFKEFGDGSSGSGTATANVSRDGWFQYSNMMVAAGAVISPTGIGSALSSNSPGFLAQSQTPIIFVGNSSVSATGKGLVGTGAVAGTCTAGGNGGFGGNGGGSGGASSTNAGCKGGNHSVFWAIADQNGGGTAGAAGSPGTAGAAGALQTIGWTNAGTLPVSGFDLGFYAGGTGAPGSNGAGITAQGVGGAGGNSGGVAVLKAPSINLTTGSTIAANGSGGGTGTVVTTTGGCGGGGGGGTAGFIGYFSVNLSTGMTASGAAANTACSALSPASSNGGAGADGNLVFRILG